MHPARLGTEESSSNREGANFGGTVEIFRGAVFDCPALVEVYNVAALDGLNKP